MTKLTRAREGECGRRVRRREGTETAMLWLLYNVLFTIGYVLMLPRFLLRMWRRGGYREGFLQRFGIYGPDVRARLRGRRHLWVHAVSVGEIYVALRFMEEIRSRLPGTAFVLSTTTSTGHRIGESKLGPDDVLVYFPSDFAPFVERALEQIQPSGLVLTECELWPNLLRRVSQRGIPIVLINGRISDGSFRGYRMLRVFFRRIVERLDLCLVQSSLDRDRLIELGAKAERVRAMGSAKYDVTRIDPGRESGARAVLDAVGVRPDDVVLVGGSTWPGEEGLLLDAYREIERANVRIRLVLAPRHVERRREIEGEIRRRGLTYQVRSEMGRGAGQASPDVLLIDTTGELTGFYACSSVVFVGKSLTRRGGQNPIEPAAFGKPIIVGPHMENFQAVMEDFLLEKAIVQVERPDQLAPALRELIGNPDLRSTYGERARRVVERRRGVVRDAVDAMLPFILIQPASGRRGLL